MSEDMEEITIVATWETTHRVEVPTGWRPGSTLSDWPEHVLEEVNSSAAELIDWRSS